MLDRSKVLKDISRLSPKLFPDLSQANTLAQDSWRRMVQDPTFEQRVQAAKSSFLVPGWLGALDETFDESRSLDAYTVVAVDGSQIYPDRHIAGAGCFLLNMGGSVLTYGQQSRVELFSQPQVCTPDELMISQTSSFSADLVDLKREELEFIYATRKLDELIAKEAQQPLVCLVDGSIIFWHLEGKVPEVKNHYLDAYLKQLDYFYHHKILVAGYISFPKSKELVNLVKLSLCRFSVADCIPCHSNFTDFPCKAVDSLIDTTIVRSLVTQGQRTTIFSSSSKITEHYPERLKPHFFYLDVGKEIARIEIPFWIAQDPEAVSTICQVAIDQSAKGGGYPVCLAEAHEQAVVKGPDRNFFFHVITKLGMENKKKFVVSQKSLKKRGMGV